MSLILVVHDASRGIICSDGRALSLSDSEIVSNDRTKHYVLRRDFILGAVGQGLTVEYLRRLIIKELDTSPALTFCELLALTPLAAQAAWEQQSSRESAAEGISVVVVGFDAERGRVRAVHWESSDFAPKECDDDVGYICLGIKATFSPVVKLVEEMRTGTGVDDDTIIVTMRGVARESAALGNLINENLTFNIIRASDFNALSNDREKVEELWPGFYIGTVGAVGLANLIVDKIKRGPVLPFADLITQISNMARGPHNGLLGAGRRFAELTGRPPSWSDELILVILNCDTAVAKAAVFNGDGFTWHEYDVGEQFTSQELQNADMAKHIVLRLARRHVVQTPKEGGNKKDQ